MTLSTSLHTSPANTLIASLPKNSAARKVISAHKQPISKMTRTAKTSAKSGSKSKATPLEILNLENKESILHFVPKRILDELTSVNKIQYKIQNRKGNIKEKSLKTGKLMQMVHMLISKHYMKDQELYNLNAERLREDFGTNYNFYVSYLVSKGILKLKKKHSQYKHSRIYQLNLEIFSKNEGIVRIPNFEKFVVKHWVKKRMASWLKSSQASTEPNACLSSIVKNKLIEDLYHVELDFEAAHNELIDMHNNGLIDDIKYHKNLGSISSIDAGDIFFTEDDYGRFHTNFTTLKKCIRSKHLKIDGHEVCEVDITNSQPMFLTILLKDNGFDVDCPVEYERFKEIVKDGKIYEMISEASREVYKKRIIDRDDAKEIMYKVMFGKHGDYNNVKANKIFKSLFPNIWTWTIRYKNENNNHKLVAWELQRRESQLVFGEICYRIKKDYPHIRLFTVHDSIYFPKQYKDIVEEIFYNRVDLIFNN